MTCPGMSVKGVPITTVFDTGRSLTTVMLVIVMLPELLTLPVKTSRSPGATGFAGHCFVTVSLGVGRIGQMAVALAVTLLLRHTSAPRTVAVSEMFVSQRLIGTMKLPAKSAVSPGARVNGPITGVLLLGWLSTTTIPCNVILPALLTVPLKRSGWPSGTGAGGQFFVIVMRGRTRVGQAALELAVTFVPLQMLAPVAMRVSKYSQQFGGTSSLPIKLVD